MILNEKQTSIAYRCPTCGAVVMSMVGIFSLTADMLKLKCTCGGSELVIAYNKDKKIRLTVPCLICPTPHNYNLSSSLFFGKELFELTCYLSGIGICFIGSSEKILEAMDRSEKELLQMLNEAGYDNIDTLGKLRGEEEDEEEFMTDPQILEILNYVVAELEDEGKITCRCTDDGAEGEYDIHVHDTDVIIRCDRCGAKKSIHAGSITGAQAFLECDRLDLE